MVVTTPHKSLNIECPGWEAQPYAGQSLLKV